MAKYLSNPTMLMREAIVMMLRREVIVMMLRRNAIMMMAMTDAIMMMMLMRDQSNGDDADSMLIKEAMVMVMIIA